MSYVYFCLPNTELYLSSEYVPGVMLQLFEESSGRTAYQPSVRILKRDRAADAANSANQLVYVITFIASDVSCQQLMICLLWLLVD